MRVYVVEIADALDDRELTTYSKIRRVRVAGGALFLLKENGHDCYCYAPGQWIGYETEGADVD